MTSGARPSMPTMPIGQVSLAIAAGSTLHLEGDAEHTSRTEAKKPSFLEREKPDEDDDEDDLPRHRHWGRGR